MASTKTYAANPANLPFSFTQYIKCFPVIGAAVVIGPIAAFIFLYVKIQNLWAAAIFTALVGVCGYQTLAGNARRRFKEGNLCAATVVSTAPFTIAVLTDLCNDRAEPKLAVKIRTLPLEKMTGGPPKLGTRLAAASLYEGEIGTGSWTGFTTIIVNCGCTDQAAINRALDSIDPRDWQILTQAMKTLKPTELGLHHIQA